jgi:hypothetical protein
VRNNKEKHRRLTADKQVASREAGRELGADRTKCMVMSREQKAKLIITPK